MHLTKAFVAAAGLGSRLRPFTEHTPKPLIKIGEQTLLTRIMHALHQQGVQECMVNTFHLKEKMQKYLATIAYPQITISQDPELLGNGGGVLRTLGFFEGQPFWVINGDSWWQDGPVPALKRMQQAWDPEKMDILLLLAPHAKALGFAGAGDYFCDADGRLTALNNAESAPFIFASVLILHPRVFLPFAFRSIASSRDATSIALPNFSLKIIFDQIEHKGRLFGLIHDKMWADVGTPEALQTLTNWMAENK